MSDGTRDEPTTIGPTQDGDLRTIPVDLCRMTGAAGGHGAGDHEFAATLAATPRTIQGPQWFPRRYDPGRGHASRYSAYRLHVSGLRLEGDIYALDPLPTDIEMLF